jgi:pimeloyl-ACP methyl ester carboxylesterase
MSLPAAIVGPGTTVRRLRVATHAHKACFSLGLKNSTLTTSTIRTTGGRYRALFMTAVFVHGVPETHQVWDKVRHHLERKDTTAPALPGFGTPVPNGFGSTMDEYAAWLTGELVTMVERDGPVDLVGHDWGGAFTFRVVSTRPDLVRTWVIDSAGLADPQFVWHDFAKLWQTPGDGEAFFTQQLATPVDERATPFTTLFAVPEAEARDLVSHIDRRMADSILPLYRSATKVNTEWGPAFEAVPKPGLVVVPNRDPFIDDGASMRAGTRAGATVRVLDGIGHWWILQDPEGAAQLLEEFWASV